MSRKSRAKRNLVCPTCGRTFKTESPNRTNCHKCSGNRGNRFGAGAEPCLSAGQIDQYLRMAEDNETALPWERVRLVPPKPRIQDAG